MPSDYETGYHNGESSMSADWLYAMNEQAGIPDVYSGSLTEIAAYIRALRSFAYDEEDSEEAVNAEIARRFTKEMAANA